MTTFMLFLLNRYSKRDVIKERENGAVCDSYGEKGNE
jgi:hypothetical protein